MNQYYYTVSALPLLFYETDVQEDTMKRFVDFCTDWLSPEDLHLLLAADYSSVREPVMDYPLLQKWQEWERSLRNALVELRASKKGIEPYSFQIESPKLLGMDELSREAFIQESPLVAEDILNHARWAFLDDLETGHYFDIDKLIVYYLKLQILFRKGQFKKDTGKKVYDELFEKLTNYDVQEAMRAS